MIFFFPTQVRGLYPALIVTVIAPMLVYVGSIIPCPDTISLSIARFLGEISYPVYCLHLPIARIVFLLSDSAHLPIAFATITSILLSIGVAWVATRLYDEPFRAYLAGPFSRWLHPANSFQKVKVEG